MSVETKEVDTITGDECRSPGGSREEVGRRPPRTGSKNIDHRTKVGVGSYLIGGTAAATLGMLAGECALASLLLSPAATTIVTSESTRLR